MGTGGIMKCPRCQHENLAAAKFCEECADPLGRVCPGCGMQVSATAKRCQECASPISVVVGQLRLVSPVACIPQRLADKILTSRAALEGERKQVTVLFADVEDFTRLGDRMDPEDLHELLDRV